MADALEIEVDGQPIDEAPHARGAAPRWGLPGAIAVAGLLAIAVLVVVIVPSLTRRPQQSPASTRGSATGGNPTTVATPAEVDERIAAAEAALDAWGRFAITGDTAVLETTFDMDGPQYRDLVTESAAIASTPPGPPAYDIQLERANAEAIAGDEALVSAAVIWARPGEEDQWYEWEMIVHRTPSGRWLLWTVRSRS